ncbi:MAG: type II secretion system F family protein [Coriobacteriales bacterium]|jgi:type IV pilus assembly protein PilC|nr:type II secretion system F family protein [Coriobacteriales bacterium]
MAGKGNELTPAELSLLFSNLALVYHSGLSLSEGFEILDLNASNPAEQKLMAVLYQAAVDGDSLYDSLSAIEGLPDYALSLIHIGEKTGRMEETFVGLRDYYQKRDELAQSIRASLVYPLTMMVMVFVVVIVLLTQAMPVFEQVFAQLGFTMTGFSGALLAIGNALSGSALVIGAVVVVLIVIKLILRATSAGKRFFNSLYENLPFTRDISLRMSTQRFALALSTMLKSGLDSDQALRYVEPLIENRHAKAKVHAIRQKIENGESLQRAIEESQLFPAASMALLSVGFRTGTDAEALNQIGQNIMVATERKMENLVSAIEPTLVGIMCVIVGIILLSVMLPLMGVLASI